MIPYAFATSLPSVAVDDLWLAGFRGIIIDVDNTLLGFESKEVASDVLAWIAKARMQGFEIVLLSNNFSPRVARLAALLQCGGIANALKPLPFGFLRARRLLGTRKAETVVIGDQLMTDILGAALVGIHGVLVNPITPKDFPLTKVLRMIERCFIGSRRPQQ